MALQEPFFETKYMQVKTTKNFERCNLVNEDDPVQPKAIYLPLGFVKPGEVIIAKFYKE